MLSAFNYEKLGSLLKDFYTLTGIRIVVFDDKKKQIAAFPELRPAICNYIRTNPNAECACSACDAIAIDKSSEKKSPYIYRCHAKLVEAVAPVFLGKLPIAYLMFGHLFPYTSYETGFQEINNACVSYNLDPVHLKELVGELPFISPEKIFSAANILMAVASWLCIDQMITLQKNELPVQIDEYINTNLSTPLSTKVLCDHFSISKTKLYQISKEYYRKGIADHIRQLRLEHSKYLLEDATNHSLNEIMELCGFNDYNNFITLFRQHYGVSPARYRKQMRGHNERS